MASGTWSRIRLLVVWHWKKRGTANPRHDLGCLHDFLDPVREALFGRVELDHTLGVTSRQTSRFPSSRDVAFSVVFGPSTTTTPERHLRSPVDPGYESCEKPRGKFLGGGTITRCESGRRRCLSLQDLGSRFLPIDEIDKKRDG